VNVFRSHVYQSYYSAVYEEGKTNEYCMQLEENGRIKNITFGGQDSGVMLGHVYFSKAFSEKFLDILVREYNEPFVDGMLWEDLYIKHIDELDLYIKKYDKLEVFEFDTLDDLRLFDKNYINNTNSKIMKNICKVLSCKEEDITNIETIKKGLTNNSFIFQCKDKKYVYRYPGTGTEEIINRQSEAVSQNLAKKLQLDDTLIYISAEEGWKISHFIENCVDFDYHNEEHLKKGLKLVKTLHDANEKSHWDFNIFAEAQKLEDLTVKSGRNDFTDFKELKDKISKLYQLVEADGIEKRICHNDCYDPNFLTNGEVMYLIDWEYSGNSDPASDLGTFICCSDYTVEEAIDVLKIYFGREMTDIEKRHYLGYVAISSYYWFVWAIYKESVGDNIGEYTYLWYKYAKTYGKIALELYGN
jgi:thiamine kinase-like enzyme